MSNLFKTGAVGFTPIESKPYIVESNSRVIESIQTKGQNNDQNNEGTGGKVIRPYNEKKEEEQEKSDYLKGANTQAELILQAAKKQADEIIQNALLKVSEITENARREGFDQGLAEGNSEAMKKADEYLQNLQKEQDELVERFEEERDAYISDAKDKVIELTCSLIERLTGVLVENYKSVMLHMINSALNNEETSSRLIIKVPSESFLYVSDNKERLLGATNPSVVLEIYEDTKLKTGQCIIETDNGIVDLSMDVQIKNLITAIRILSE